MYESHYRNRYVSSVMLDNKIIENLKPKTNVEVLIENERNIDRTKFDQGTIFLFFFWYCDSIKHTKRHEIT